jgi:hypothetical protein
MASTPLDQTSFMYDVIRRNDDELARRERFVERDLGSEEGRGADRANPLLIREASRLRKMLTAFVSGAAGFVVTTPSSLHIVPVASPRCTSAHAMAVSEPPEAKTTRPWQRSQALLDEAAAKRAAFEALSAKSVDDTKEQRVAEDAAAKRAAFEAQVAAEKEKKAVIAEEMKAKGFTIVEAKPEPEPEPEPEVEKPVKKRGGFSLNFGFGGKKTVEAPQEVAEVKPAAVAKPPTPKPAAPPAAKAAKPAPTPAAVEETQSEGETPARAFERIMAPFYIPPAVAKARPELVEKYKSGK